MQSNSQSIGRNEPCPCGSGKKYKKCCMLGDNNPARQAREELQDAMKEQKFESLEDAQAFVTQHMEMKNSRPLDEFGGLSPYQMHRLLQFPFESPDVIRFNFDSAVSTLKEVPILHLLTLIVDSLGEKGLKPTATGNLPRKVSREIAQLYLSEKEHARFTRLGNFMSEDDVPDLKQTRLVAKLAGLIRLYRGRILASKECKQMIAVSNWPGLFQKLFMTYIQKFNWAWPNGFIEVPFFQQSFAVTLYFLHKFGADSREGDFYAERFVAAFPMLTNDILDTEYMTAEKLLQQAYSSQVLDSFGEIMGLVKSEWKEHKHFITPLPLLHRLVRFPR